MKQFGTGLRRGALVSIFLMWVLSGAGYAAGFDDDAIRAAYEDALAGRARLDFHPEFTADGDSLAGWFWPEWIFSVYKTGDSAWAPSVGAWFVPEGTEGQLVISLNREMLNRDLTLDLEFYDGGGSDNAAYLFVDLVDENGEALSAPDGEKLSSERYGNLLEGSGEQILTKAMLVPLEENQEAVGIRICARGEVFVLGVVLASDRAEGMGGSPEVFHTGTDRAAPDEGGASGLGEQASAASDRSDSAVPTLPEVGTAGRAKPWAGPDGHRGRIAARAVSAQTIPQFVQALLMTDSDYQISRDVLSGGGGRQVAVAANLILEDTFAQASAIGFSSNSSIILHAGYQQADDQSLAITNVSVIPLRFNPSLGEVATLSYVLSTRPRGISLEVSNAVTFAAFSLTNNLPQGPGLGSFVWDGRDTNGNLLAPADWTFRILARDYQGRVLTNADALVTIRPAATMPVILAVDDNPDPFCPTVDGATAISYTTAESQNRDLDVTVAIEDAAGNSVANFSTNNQVPGSYALNWDGAGATRNGLYVYRINAWRSQGGQAANERTGSIILSCGHDCASSADGNVRVCYQPGAFTLAVMPASPGQLSSASFALLTQGGLLFQSGLYDIQATPATGFDPPAILSFQYDSAISGAIGGKLELRQYDEASAIWVVVANQFVDYAHNQIIAEVTNLSLFALFAVEQPAAPGVLTATVRLEPEVLKVNPGILTAFVSLPEGFAASGIVAATCDGAASESMELSADGTEMIVKFRRQAIEAALAAQGETLDTHFVVEGIWQGAEGSIPFAGEDDISRIVYPDEP